MANDLRISPLYRSADVEADRVSRAVDKSAKSEIHERCMRLLPEL